MVRFDPILHFAGDKFIYFLYLFCSIMKYHALIIYSFFDNLGLVKPLRVCYRDIVHLHYSLVPAEGGQSLHVTEPYPYFQETV